MFSKASRAQYRESKDLASVGLKSLPKKDENGGWAKQVPFGYVNKRDTNKQRSRCHKYLLRSPAHSLDANSPCWSETNTWNLDKGRVVN